MSFLEKIRRASEKNGSRIVLALDLEGTERKQLEEASVDILRNTSQHLCAVKINRQLVLALGLKGGVDSIVQVAHQLSLPAIMDAKLNDVGHTNEFMMRSYIEAGFDAVVASPVAGWEGGLDGVFKLANSHQKGVLLLVYMSNPGAAAFYSLTVGNGGKKPGLMFERLTELAVEWGAHGIVVGATRPEIISHVRELTGLGMDIYTPGVAVQGGDAKKALDAGADYLIVGRAIYNADDPAKAAKNFRDIT